MGRVKGLSFLTGGGPAGKPWLLLQAASEGGGPLIAQRQRQTKGKHESKSKSKTKKEYRDLSLR
jgi:hypothetical protein